MKFFVAILLIAFMAGTIFRHASNRALQWAVAGACVFVALGYFFFNLI